MAKRENGRMRPLASESFFLAGAGGTTITAADASVAFSDEDDPAETLDGDAMAADATCAPGPGETACANPDPHTSAMTLHRILILDIRSSPRPAIQIHKMCTLLGLSASSPPTNTPQVVRSRYWGKALWLCTCAR
jgi:hypothetical protein